MAPHRGANKLKESMTEPQVYQNDEGGLCRQRTSNNFTQIGGPCHSEPHIRTVKTTSQLYIRIL